MRRRSRSTRTRNTMLATIALASLAGAMWWFWPNAGRSALASGPPMDAAPAMEPSAGGDAAGLTNSEDSQTTIGDGEASMVAGDALAHQGGAGAGTIDDEILAPRRSGLVAADTDSAAAPGFESDPRGDAESDEPPAGTPASPTPPVEAPPPATSDNPLVKAAIARYERGETLAARQELNRLLQTALPERDQNAVRQALRRIADETIFSGRVTAGDPLLEVHVVRSGDNPNAIAARYKIPGEGVMLMNNIKDPSKLRLDQKLAVPREPFHVRISKSKLRLDIYLGDTYVRSYPVGLGGPATPEGEWRVKNRLANPTYYPPASAQEKRIIPPHDPRNPLGERWIGLEGVEGQALGADGYGIHGTADPDSIGKNVSLGCVRMHNADVRFLYALLSPGDSTVKIQP